ncbi:hypothetical protein [Spongiimicrobium salis]|uniref:hypothetical protein n=1 Tax=Spongiimicrobium salis TaxID=1667022 RepID=UPI00374DD24D
MFELFYALFEPYETDWETWNRTGFFLGFLTLFVTSFIFCLVYYLVLGRGGTKRYASMQYWFLFMLFNSFLNFLLTVILCGFVAFETKGDLGSIVMDIWRFSLWNGTAYAILFYLFWSLVFNRFSIHHKYIPFKLF